MAISASQKQRRVTPEGREARLAQGARRRARRKAEGKPIRGGRSASSTPRDALLRNHGLRPEDLAAMVAAQQRECYLCGAKLGGGKSVHIDHDHSCCPQGKSCSLCRRGVACQQCNVAIGLAGDDPARLRRMADALESAKTSAAARIAAGPRQLGLFDA